MELAGKVLIGEGDNQDDNINHIEAHTFDEWCAECGCIHLEEVFKESVRSDDTNENIEEQAVAELCQAQTSLI